MEDIMRYVVVADADGRCCYGLMGKVVDGDVVEYGAENRCTMRFGTTLLLSLSKLKRSEMWWS